MTIGSDRLGNQRLGASEDGEGGSRYGDQIEDLVATIETAGPDGSKERLESHMKPVFKTDDGTIWDGLLTTLAGEFEEFISARNDVFLGGFVDTAEGKELDKIGKFVQTPRKTDELDSHYRPRLKVNMRRLLSGGTIPDIKQTSAMLLDTDRSEIRVTEDFSTESARFTIEVKSQLIEDSQVSVDEFLELVTEIKAAGVRAIATTRGMFEYRSASDYQDGITNQEKGYDGLDADGNRQGIGGEYRSLL